MKLFYNPASPFVRKVMVTAIECGLQDQIDIDALALTPVNPSDSLNAENPLGKIPSLVLDNGDTLFDSRVICEYLNELGHGSLFPAGEARWDNLRRQAMADGICDAGVLVRYETFARPQEKQWDHWIENQKLKFRRALQVLETDASSFAGKVDIGALSIAIALDYIDFRYADEDWRTECPALAEWHTSISARESLQQTRPTDLAS
ncbi:MAG: glutathione S-transferase [Pseudomonadota bacterium]